MTSQPPTENAQCSAPPATLSSFVSGLWSLCGVITSSGHRCWHSAGRCPFHPLDDSADLPPAASPAKRPHEDVRVLGQLAVERVLELDASPLQAARFVRTLNHLHAMGQTPMDEEAALKEIELRGLIMSGCPPRNEEEWARARAIFDDTAIAEFERWQRRQDLSLPERDPTYQPANDDD